MFIKTIKEAIKRHKDKRLKRRVYELLDMAYGINEVAFMLDIPEDEVRTLERRRKPFD